jgi:hypothetical protein
MKKVASIFAIVLMSLGMFSVTADSPQNDNALNIQQATLACDQCHIPPDPRT